VREFCTPILHGLRNNYENHFRTGPPSPQNGSRLSSGRRGVNTKLSESESFPQTANAYHRRTEQYEIWNKQYRNVNEPAMCCHRYREIESQSCERSRNGA
jgi:hypothetical protein